MTNPMTNLQLRMESFTEKERNHARSVFEAARKKFPKVRLTLSDIADHFILLGSGLDFVDARLRTRESETMDEWEPLTDETLLKTKDIDFLNPTELQFVKYALVNLRNAGYGEATLQTLMATYTMLGTGFEDNLKRQNDTYPLFQMVSEEKFMNAIGFSTIPVMGEAALPDQTLDPAGKKESGQLTQNSSHQGNTGLHTSVYNQKRSRTDDVIEVPNLADKKDLTLNDSHQGNAGQSRATPEWQELHGPALATTGNFVLANIGYTMQEIIYRHNPLYMRCNSMAELLQKMFDDCIIFNKGYVIVMGPLFPCLFGKSAATVLGPVTGNNCPQAIDVINKINEVVKHIKATTPALWAEVEAGNGRLGLSDIPMVHQMQMFTIQDMCRRVLRLIMLERVMMWILQSGLAPQGASCNGTMMNNTFNQLPDLKFMVLENHDLGHKVSLPQPGGRGGQGYRGTHQGPRGSNRGGGGAGGRGYGAQQHPPQPQGGAH